MIIQIISRWFSLTLLIGKEANMPIRPPLADEVGGNVGSKPTEAVGKERAYGFLKEKP